jgi:hypothetical protein
MQIKIRSLYDIQRTINTHGKTLIDTSNSNKALRIYEYMDVLDVLLLQGITENLLKKNSTEKIDTLISAKEYLEFFALRWQYMLTLGRMQFNKNNAIDVISIAISKIIYTQQDPVFKKKHSHYTLIAPSLQCRHDVYNSIDIKNLEPEEFIITDDGNFLHLETMIDQWYHSNEFPNIPLKHTMRLSQDNNRTPLTPTEEKYVLQLNQSLEKLHEFSFEKKALTGAPESMLHYLYLTLYRSSNSSDNNEDITEDNSGIEIAEFSKYFIDSYEENRTKYIEHVTDIDGLDRIVENLKSEDLLDRHKIINIASIHHIISEIDQEKLAISIGVIHHALNTRYKNTKWLKQAVKELTSKIINIHNESNQTTPTQDKQENTHRQTTIEEYLLFQLVNIAHKSKEDRIKKLEDQHTYSMLSNVINEHENMVFDERTPSQPTMLLDKLKYFIKNGNLLTSHNDNIIASNKKSDPETQGEIDDLLTQINTDYKKLLQERIDNPQITSLIHKPVKYCTQSLAEAVKTISKKGDTAGKSDLYNPKAQQQLFENAIEMIRKQEPFKLDQQDYTQIIVTASTINEKVTRNKI